jgi:hypothetical protein
MDVMTADNSGPDSSPVRIVPGVEPRQGVFCALLVAAYAVTAARALQMPNPYAVGFWIQSYEFGFIKRGLPGSLVMPLFAHKTAEEAYFIIAFLSAVIFTVLSGALVWAAVRIGRDGLKAGHSLLGFGCSMVFATSPFVVFNAHLMGYLDHLVVLATLAGVVLAASGRYGAVGILSVVALFSHEMYALAGFPMVLFAVVLGATRRGGPRGATLARPLTLTLVPTGLACTAVVTSSLMLPMDAVAKLKEQMTALGVVHPAWVEMCSYHLSHHLLDNLRSQWASGAERLFDGGILASAAPPAVFLFAGGIAMLRPRNLLGFAPGYAVAALLPLAMHWIAWDSARITNFVIFQAFSGLLAIQLITADDPDRVRVTPSVRAATATLGALILVYNFGVSVELMGGESDGEGLLELRAVPTPSDHACRALLFPNSDFEKGTLSGWKAVGGAFARGPVAGAPAEFKHLPGNQDRHWVSSFYRAGGNGGLALQGDEATGRLMSTPFTIDGREIGFQLAGGRDAANLYVALEVGGAEVERATGRRSDHMRSIRWNVDAHRGRNARIVVMDGNSERWGRISADAFCYTKQ